MYGAMAVVVAGLLGGCVVVRHDSTWGSGSTSGTSWTPPANEGEVELDWRVGADGCEAAGVATVEVDLGGTVTTFDCAEQAGIARGPVGTVPLTVQGLDVDGVPRYGADAGEVRVRRDQVVVGPSVVLTALPAALQATWYFENSRLCSANGVEVVEATLLDEDDVQAAQQTADCADGALVMQDLEPGAYLLLLLGRGEGGLADYTGEVEIVLAPGDRAGADVALIGGDE